MNAGKILCSGANHLWKQINYRSYSRFVSSLQNPLLAQENYLKRLLKYNASTKYGQANHFAGITSLREFQQNIPVTQYEDYSAYIDEISRGTASVLTNDPANLFQPTSGTSSPSKLIPYNKSLRNEYRRAIAVWIYALYQRLPALMRGRAYWSISPENERPKSYGCVPIGFDDDSEYLNGMGKVLHQLVSVEHGKFRPNVALNDFWDETLFKLINTRDLTLISVWSPTFLLNLIKHLDANRAKIFKKLASYPLSGSPGRIAEIKQAFSCININYEIIWPALKLISCWTHGTSEHFIPEIRRFFPRVEIEGKGLIATEAFVSIPLLPYKDPVLALNSHFFEFRDTDSNEMFLADNLAIDKEYSVIVTTGGGLYRYELNDLVRVTGFIGRTPTIRFISKNYTSDLVGEKLNAQHIQRSIESALMETGIDSEFHLVAPVNSPSFIAHYAIFLATRIADARQLQKFEEKLEILFLENYHYAHCRKLKQLEHIKVFKIDCSQSVPEMVYLNEMYHRGQKPGDIKPSVLDRGTGWEKRFFGRFLDSYTEPDIKV